MRMSARAVAAIATACVLVPLVAYCARSYPRHALYFDQTMYQYTAWCLRHGERLYDTVAVPDGPLITWIHAAVQMLVGTSDPAFRWADLVIQVTCALAIGALVAPYRARVAWAAAVAALWLAQYFRYDWHWTAQREAYYSLIGYAGMALLLLASRRRGRAQLAWSLVGGALVALTLFGKHIGAIFVVLGLLPAVLAPRALRRHLFLLACAGVALGLALGVIALVATASLDGFWFWYFEVPRPYRFIMGSADFFPLLRAIDRHTTLLALVTLVGGGILCGLRWVPRRLVGFAVAPTLFLLAMVLQRKGHVYQAHPVTAGCYLAIAMFTLALLRRPGRLRVVGAIVLALVVTDAARGLVTSTWIDPQPPTGRSQLGAPHIAHGDLFAAGRKIASFTRPSDRVFAYGPAGRLLLKAERAPAVPPFNNFFFNVHRAALIALTEDQRAALDRVQREIAARSCPRLADPPAAVAVCDGADFSGGPGLTDAREVCPILAYVALPTYVEVGIYGCWHVYARHDRTPPP